MKSISFFVAGVPRPQGSKRLVGFKTGHVHMIEASPEHKNWRASVSGVAHEAVAREKLEMIDGPVALEVRFQFVRPASHYGKHGVKPSAPPYPKAYDLDKLVRSVGDSLSGIVYRDDVEIITIIARKEWGDTVGALVKVSTVEMETKTEPADVAKSERLPGL